MSRAYRISVNETLKRVIRAQDHVSTQLEILGILSPEEMAQLLADELKGRGFKQQGDELVREKNGVKVSVDPSKGIVKVESELQEKLEIEGSKEGRVYTDVGPQAKTAKENLRKDLRDDLEKQAQAKEAKVQAEATDKLEEQLGDLREELDQTVNRVTAEALKRKAAQLGAIKEMTEDPQSGSLTIVLEV
jgi:hypothetical protein